MLKLHPSITSPIFPVSFILLIGGLLTSSSLPAQDNQWTKAPESQWINLPDSSAQQRTQPHAYFRPKAYFTAKRATPAVIKAAKAQALAARGAARSSISATLPLWFYNVTSPRDNNGYFGIMIGNDPFNGGGTARVPTYIVPVVIRTNTVGVSVDPKTGIISTMPGVTTFDPSAADNACLSEPNNVPATVFRQSPIFENANFTFGGVSMGYTQYIDAFQRASFWQVLPDQNDYHVLLDPVNQLAPIVIDVPAAHGTTFPASICGPLGIVDIDWLDTYLTTVVLPALTSQGVNSGSFPVFQLYNVVEGFPATDLNDCCVLGYHSYNGPPYSAPPVQTYAVADFDTTGLFPAGLQDTGILSHEIGEWINDPFTFNPTPPWGNTGQVSGCQGNLEVGDPLTGSLAPSVIMPNGFTYRLQEMAFYSWFLGGPSVGVNGWYSNNASFLKDAGPVCQQ